MKNQRPCFPSHTPILPSLLPSVSRVLTGFSPLALGCVGGDRRRDRKKVRKERQKERREQEKEGEKTGKEGGL